MGPTPPPPPPPPPPPQQPPTTNCNNVETVHTHTARSVMAIQEEKHDNESYGEYFSRIGNLSRTDGGGGGGGGGAVGGADSFTAINDIRADSFTAIEDILGTAMNPRGD